MSGVEISVGGSVVGGANNDNSSSNNSLGSAYIGSFGSNVGGGVGATHHHVGGPNHTTPHAHPHPFTHSLSLNVTQASPQSASTAANTHHGWPYPPQSPAPSSSLSQHHLHHHLSAGNYHNFKPSSPISVILRQTSNSPVRPVHLT